MAAKTAPKLGPGFLKFGKTGSQKEFGAFCTECTITPETKMDDAEPVLSGDTFAGDIEKSFKIEGKIKQTYDKDSLILWCWQNDGTVMEFEYTPLSDGALTVKGSVMIAAVPVGGEAGKTNDSEFEFSGVGEATMTTKG